MEIVEFENRLKDASVTYCRPIACVEKMYVSENYSDEGRYVIVDGNESDCGGFVIEASSLPTFWFDWYDGSWNSKDDEMRGLLRDASFLAILDKRFGEAMICLGPEGKRCSLSTWRKSIALCLGASDSADCNIDVMYDYKNASLPENEVARHSLPRQDRIDDDWYGRPSLGEYLENFT